MPKVIQWVNPREDEIIWKYPDEEIEWGSQLIVREHEVAVFFRDGKVYDVLGPGRHTLTTLNLPLLTRALSSIMGFDKIPFRASVIFVSMKRFQGKFGGRTQTIELAPLMFHGTFWFKVSDPRLFITEIVGGRSIYETSDVSRFLRGYFNENLMKYLSTYSIFDVYQSLDRVSMEVKVKLLADFRRIGLELVDLKFEGVDTTGEWREKIFWLRQTGQAAYVLQMQTLKEVAKELGKSPGAATGTGLVLLPQLMQPQQQQPSPPPPPSQPVPSGVVCPRCGNRNPPNAKFCMYCGAPLGGTKTCPACGRTVPVSAKFCPYCGAKLEGGNTAVLKR
ncbi:MAG: hypothetical protein DRJ52_02775 [Thermoprotei archaeon]|nr:MAG: hypothetical protein DRJ52_02775 [Thermoprotei archaeon]RLF00179.1 MAG: hypothetical protein DRJ63_03130 [Thermoprotei archaeon]HDI75288.1 SPFH domain-containing protein [Thermoprotei archaeon]